MQRLCELLAIYIAVELRVCKETKVDILMVANRIVYLLRQYLKKSDEVGFSKKKKRKKDFNIYSKLSFL